MSEHFDFVIVGGGSAGAVIASRRRRRTLGLRRGWQRERRRSGRWQPSPAGLGSAGLPPHLVADTGVMLP